MDLHLPDAIVLASVLSHLDSCDQAEEKCFLQRDRKDFLTPEIQDALAEKNCRMIGRFSDGLGFVRNVLS